MMQQKDEFESYFSDLSNYKEDLIRLENNIRKCPLDDEIYSSLYENLSSLSDNDLKFLIELNKLGDLNSKECLGYINFIKLRFNEDIVLDIIYKTSNNVARESLRRLIEKSLILINKDEKTILIPEIVFINKKLLIDLLNEKIRRK